MKNSNSTEIVNDDFQSESKLFTIGVYPKAFCLIYKYEDESKHYQILADSAIVRSCAIGYSIHSQDEAWENAWSVISKKLMKKLTS
jgi:hypothetical protein